MTQPLAGGWRARRRVVVGDDRGEITLLAVAATAIAMLLLALLVAGGAALRTRSDAFALASTAARTGAQQLDQAAAVEGQTVLDPVAAEQAALAYLAARGAQGSVAITGATITVTVTSSTDLPLATRRWYSCRVISSNHPTGISIVPPGTVLLTNSKYASLTCSPSP